MSEVKKLLEQVREAAKQELEFCNPDNTPAVCNMISTPEGKEKILNLILEYIGNSGMSVSEAIVTIERENNPLLNNE